MEGSAASLWRNTVDYLWNVWLALVPTVCSLGSLMVLGLQSINLNFAWMFFLLLYLMSVRFSSRIYRDPSDSAVTKDDLKSIMRVTEAQVILGISLIGNIMYTAYMIEWSLRAPQ